jgi:hypothetical protein
VGRAQAQRRHDFRARLVELVLVQQQRGKGDAGADIAGVEADRLGEVLLRPFLVVAKPLQFAAQRQRLGVLRVARQHALDRRERQVALAEAKIELRQAEMGPREAGIERQGLVERLLRLVQPPVAHVRVAAPGHGDGLQRLVIVRTDEVVVEVADLVGDRQDASEQVDRLGVAQAEFDRAADFLVGRHHVAEAQGDVGERRAGLRVVGVVADGVAQADQRRAVVALGDLLLPDDQIVGRGQHLVGDSAAATDDDERDDRKDPAHFGGGLRLLHCIDPKMAVYFIG